MNEAFLDSENHLLQVAQQRRIFFLQLLPVVRCHDFI
jgi:hypothetical protein